MTQSSDREFHCLTITLFYAHARAAAAARRACYASGAQRAGRRRARCRVLDEERVLLGGQRHHARQAHRAETPSRHRSAAAAARARCTASARAQVALDAAQEAVQPARLGARRRSRAPRRAVARKASLPGASARGRRRRSRDHDTTRCMRHAPDGLKVFSGLVAPAAGAARSATCSASRSGASHTMRFSNENLKVKIEENVREQDVFVVQTACPPLSEDIVELLILLDALKHASARRVTAVLPYFPYARSDKKDEPRISITARLMADLLATAGADRVLTIDLHSPQIQGFFSMPADQLTAVPVLCDAAAAARICRTRWWSPPTWARPRTPAGSPSGSICRSPSSTSAAPATTRRRAPARGHRRRARARTACSSTTRSPPAAPSSSATEFLLDAGRAQRVGGGGAPGAVGPRHRAARHASPPRAAARHQHHPHPAEQAVAEDRGALDRAAAGEAITRIHDGRSVSELFSALRLRDVGTRRRAMVRRASAPGRLRSSTSERARTAARSADR